MPITLGRRQWVYVSVILLIVLPVVLCFAFMNQIYSAYLHEFVAPKLENEFGFRAGTETLLKGKESFEVFLIEYIRSEGILAKAGFQSGDIPVGYKHGFESGFYQDLLSSREGEPISIQVVNINAARQGNWKWRDITLRYKK